MGANVPFMTASTGSFMAARVSFMVAAQGSFMSAPLTVGGPGVRDPQVALPLDGEHLCHLSAHTPNLPTTNLPHFPLLFAINFPHLLSQCPAHLVCNMQCPAHHAKPHILCVFAHTMCVLTHTVCARDR